ncbi:protein kinase [Kitasatospora sp. NPDC088783]|uniref:serine/threonine-protein kinase n=1 Tax=Kitasatospora sp. NPDC088783 TaxID=3364077 RepID=UPI00381FCEDF
MHEGRLVGKRYELKRLLSRGGMGQVWRARDLTLDRDVAIKMIRTDLPPEEQDELLERFKREAKATAALAHPCILEIYDACLDDDPDRAYMAAELVQGELLADVIAATPRLPVPWAVCLGVQLCSALACAHDEGIVHRDVKPENIIIGFNGTLKLLDFGIALSLTPGQTRLTGQHPIGTMHYMSPEQLLGQVTTPRADLYAVGVLMYRLLAGTLPFDGETSVNIIAAHLEQIRPRAVDATRPEVGRELGQLLQDLLAFRAEHRPSGARAVIDRLRPHLLMPAAGPLQLPGLPGLAPPVLPSPLPAARPPVSPAGGAPCTFGGLATRVDAARAMFKAGHMARALPACEALAAELANSGPENADRAREMRVQAALCRAALGEHDSALEALREELDPLVSLRPERDPEVLALRQHIGLLLSALDRIEEATEALAGVYGDLVEVFGPTSEQAVLVRDALIGIRRRPPIPFEPHP